MDSTPNVSLNVVGTTSDSKDTDSVNNENTPLIPTREAAMPISPLDGAVPSGRDDGQISGTFEAITSAEEARTPLLEVESSARGTGGGETGGRNGSMGSGIDGVEAGGALGSGGHGDGMNGRGKLFQSIRGREHMEGETLYEGKKCNRLLCTVTTLVQMLPVL